MTNVIRSQGKPIKKRPTANGGALTAQGECSPERPVWLPGRYAQQNFFTHKFAFFIVFSKVNNPKASFTLSRKYFESQKVNSTPLKKSHLNPISLAQEWQKALNEGEYYSKAEFARKMGISRARVTQVLNLLKLSPEIQKSILDLGNPLEALVITERMLRSLVDLSFKEQRRMVDNILMGNKEESG